MQEVELGGHRYRVGKLDAFKQFHLFRKLMPVLSGMGAMFSGDNEDGFTVDQNFWASMGPAATAIAEMSQQDSEYILKTCLHVCQMWNGHQWVRITTPSGELMFEDIDMMQMLQLSFEVMKDNLGSFFGVPQPNGLAVGVGEQVLPFPSSE